MIDVFVRSRTNNPIRLALAEAVVWRLQRFADLRRLYVVTARGFALPKLPLAAFSKVDVEALDTEQFHVDSRKLAHNWATSDVYVVIDDDCMPLGVNWLRDGVEAMRTYPEFAALSSWSINGEIDPERVALPPRAEVLRPVDLDVFEVAELGTPTFMRKSWAQTPSAPDELRARPVDLDCPDGPLHDYDRRLSRSIQRAGLTGMLRNVRHNHLGVGLSEVVPEWWKV